MSLKPIVNDNDALENRSLNIFAHSINCQELTVNGKPIHEDGSVTPFSPVWTFPQVPAPNTPTILNPGTVYGSIVGNIVSISGRTIISIKSGTPNGSTAVFTLPPEIASTLTGVGSVVATAFEADFPTPPVFSVIGRGVIETNQLFLTLGYCNNVATPGSDVSVDCSWVATFPRS
jgi:hypothetical protein